MSKICFCLDRSRTTYSSGCTKPAKPDSSWCSDSKWLRGYQLACLYSCCSLDSRSQKLWAKELNNPFYYQFMTGINIRLINFLEKRKAKENEIVFFSSTEMPQTLITCQFSFIQSPHFTTTFAFFAFAFLSWDLVFVVLLPFGGLSSTKNNSNKIFW